MSIPHKQHFIVAAVKTDPATDTGRFAVILDAAIDMLIFIGKYYTSRRKSFDIKVMNIRNFRVPEF